MAGPRPGHLARQSAGWELLPGASGRLKCSNTSGVMKYPVNFRLCVSYAQVAVFDRSFQRPFNQWNDRHVRQGFSWRPGSAAFRTIEEEGQHHVMLMVDTDDGDPTPSAVRVMEVPFEVPASGEIEIGSTSDSFSIRIPPGVYQLRFECERRPDNKIPMIRFQFVEMKQPQFRVIRADPDLDLNGGLLLIAT
jgi:hypothetical protein